jgi:tetratricopeptide (TPR) repeat protein
MLTLIGAFGLSTSADAQWIEMEDISRPLVENEPFDLLFLQTEGVILKIVPLRDPPQDPLPQTGNLIFEYFAESEGLLTVPFKEVRDYKTFRELLVDESEAWMAEKQYGRAFRNLLWVYDHGGKADRKVTRLLRTCLFRDGATAFENGNYELALSIFEDIYQQDRNFQVPGISQRLIDIVMTCYDKILGKSFDDEDYSTVNVTLESVQNNYPEDFEPIAKRWRERFIKKSDDLLAQSKQYARDGKGREAHMAARQAEQITPGRREVEQQNEAVLNQYPLIVVGVNQPAGDADPLRLEHWGARRVGRLTQRTVVELTGVTEEGGKYKFLNGQLTRKDEDGYEYQFTIDPEIAVFGAPKTTTFEVAARLSDLANPDSDAYNEDWAKVVETIAIDNETQVTVELRRAFVRPEALIDMTYQAPKPDGQPAQDGVYTLTKQDSDFSTFDLNPALSVDGRQKHPVVIEQRFDLATDAVTELLSGNIDMVDRVPVSDLSRLKRKPGVQARAYLVPTIHLLLPKIRGDLEKDPGFRRGLSHAIDRQTTLREVICGGQQINGCEVISGPLPIGTEENDQISYGYNFKTRPPSFNTKLGQVLMQMALMPKKRKPPAEGDADPKKFFKSAKMPTLVLAHPRSSTASAACFAIADAWNKAGVPTSTRELDPTESWPAVDNWDLLYMEIAMEEPLADITQLIGATGFVTDVSAPVDQTLAALGFTQTWQGACAMLRQLHQQIATDMSVIPLWQIKEHFAYRTTVRNVGRDLVHLYQHIEHWRIDIRPEEETE